MLSGNTNHAMTVELRRSPLYAIRRPGIHGPLRRLCHVCELLVMVNATQLPKVDIGRALARELGAHLISRDLIKEALGSGLDDTSVLPNIGANRERDPSAIRIAPDCGDPLGSLLLFWMD